MTETDGAGDPPAEGGTSTPRPRRGKRGHAAEREGRRLCLGAIFEADFGQRTAERVLDRRIREEAVEPEAEAHARRLVAAVTRYRDAIDARIEAVAPSYPVVAMARIDRALLRSAMGELLHCPTTPSRVAISEWVELARTYSGDPSRRLMNGVLGRVARDATDTTGTVSNPTPTAHRDGPGASEEGAHR